MDPYLEDPDIWADFHTSLFGELKKDLNQILPPGYQAKIDRYIWIHEPEAGERILLGKPDNFIVEKGPTAQPPQVGIVATLAAPASIVLPAIRHEGNRYLKIIDRKRQRVVTVIEILSPCNKYAGIDRDAYLLKRSEYLATGVNLIEMDFLRGGPRLPWGEQPPPPATYYIMISRRWEFPHAGVWPISEREPLPSIPIPLEQTVAEPLVDMQACFTKVYAGGRYENEIDYTQPPSPALTEPDASWAAQLTKGKVL